MMPKTLRTLALGATALACASSATAMEKVGYGWDLLRTIPSTKIYGIDLVGVPIGTYDFGTNSYGQFIGVKHTGKADTIVRRLGEAEVPEPIPPTDSDTINIQMVALQLRTKDKVDLFGLGPDYYYFTQSMMKPSTGVMTITFNREITILDTGVYGTFTSYLDVFVNVRKGCLTCPILTDGADPIVIEKNFDAIVEWHHWLDNPALVQIPGVNVFLNNQDRNWDFWVSPYGAFHITPDHDTHTVVPATIPEPGTWAMLIAGFGLVGFAARRRREAFVA